MDKEMGIPPLEESFHQKPIMTSRLARKNSQALPMSELQDLGLAQHFQDAVESSSSSTSELELEESKEQSISESRSKHMSNSKSTSKTKT